MTIREASPKQIDLITRLKGERDVSALPGLEAALSAGLTIRDASQWIDKLFAAPRAKAVAGPPVQEALANVEISKYAIPTSGVFLPGRTFHGDLLFLEVRNYMGKKYLNQLHGAPGGFCRSRFNQSETITLAALIRGRHVEYATLFGRHYSVCGRCAAELTDQKSRESGFGPECRKVFGIA